MIGHYHVHMKYTLPERIQNLWNAPLVVCSGPRDALGRADLRRMEGITYMHHRRHQNLRKQPSTESKPLSSKAQTMIFPARFSVAYTFN